MLASFPQGQGCRALDPMYQMHRVPLHFAQGVDSPEAVGCGWFQNKIHKDWGIQIDYYEHYNIMTMIRTED